MGLFNKKKSSALKAQSAESYPAPPQTKNWRLYAMAGSASFASMMFGYDSAFLGSTITLPAFEARFGLDSTTVTALSSQIVSTFQAGCFFGTLFIGPVNSKFGRRYSLITAAIVFIVGVILQLASHGSLGMLYAGRALTGLGVGSSSLLVTNYIAECSTPALRGSLVGGFELMLQTGLVVGFWMAYAAKLHLTGDKQWMIPFGIQIIPAGLLIIAMLFQHESPRWLLEKGRDEQAIKALVWLRNLPADHPYIAYEVDSIRSQIVRSEHTHDGRRLTIGDKIKMTFDKGNQRRLSIAVALMWLQNLSGINALNYFSSSLVKGIGFTGDTVALLATGVYGIVKCAATFVFMLLIIDRVGRRVPMIVGLIGAACALLYLGVYSTIAKSFDATTAIKPDGAAYFGLVCIYIFSIFYAFSINGIPWIFQSEVFPLAIRSVSMTISVMNQWLSQFVIVYAAPYMISGLAGYTFIFFSLWTFFAAGFCYFLFPETKGISLEQMDVLWSGPVFAPKMRSRYDSIMASARSEGALHPENGPSVARVADEESTSGEKDSKIMRETRDAA